MFRPLWIWQRWIRGISPESAADRFAQGLRTVHHEQPADLRIEPPLDQVVQQRLDHGSVFRRPLDNPERVLLPGTVNADGPDHQKLVPHVQPVDLDHQEIEPREVRRHPLHELRLGQRLEPP